MNPPSELSVASEKILLDLSFELIESEENSWSKSFLWTNDAMKFAIVYDRLYYDSYILAHTKPIENLHLIKLLRFLKNDPDFYKQELITVNLAYSLPINDYIKLLSDTYDIIKEFVIKYNSEKFKAYNAYEISYNGI